MKAINEAPDLVAALDAIDLQLTQAHGRTNMDKLLYSIPEAVEVTGLSRSFVYQLIKSGHIIVTKVGRRSFITRTELERFVDSLATGLGQPRERGAR